MFLLSTIFFINNKKKNLRTKMKNTKKNEFESKNPHFDRTKNQKRKQNNSKLKIIIIKLENYSKKNFLWFS